jgi:hypothetical protein
MPGLATAALIAAVKIALFNEEQLRAWHARTGGAPADHPVLQPDPPSCGFIEATHEQAFAIVAQHFQQTSSRQEQSLAANTPRQKLVVRPPRWGSHRPLTTPIWAQHTRRDEG